MHPIIWIMAMTSCIIDAVAAAKPSSDRILLLCRSARERIAFRPNLAEGGRRRRFHPRRSISCANCAAAVEVLPETTAPP